MTNLTTCPICGQTGAERIGLTINCIEPDCASNGGTNQSALRPAASIADFQIRFRLAVSSLFSTAEGLANAVQAGDQLMIDGRIAQLIRAYDRLTLSHYQLMDRMQKSDDQ